MCSCECALVVDSGHRVSARTSSRIELRRQIVLLFQKRANLQIFVLGEILFVLVDEAHDVSNDDRVSIILLLQPVAKRLNNGARLFKDHHADDMVKKIEVI